MTRSFFAVLALGVAGLALAPALLQGCSQTGVGDPCVPAREYDVTFNGFDPGEVNVESKSFQCQTRLCLANHFQGRVSCPYGQTKAGTTPPSLSGAAGPFPDTNGQPIGACGIPGSADNAQGQVVPSSDAVVGDTTPGSATGALVQPQCLDRTADKAVYCSCRCADVNGNTNDGAVYCKCPDGFACTQLVTPIGPTDTGLTGAYCIKNNTAYDPVNSCPTGQTCDPSKKNCGTFNGQ
jgi:hypothetical protein